MPWGGIGIRIGLLSMLMPHRVLPQEHSYQGSRDATCIGTSCSCPGAENHCSTWPSSALTLACHGGQQACPIPCWLFKQETGPQEVTPSCLHSTDEKIEELLSEQASMLRTQCTGEAEDGLAGRPELLRLEISPLRP